MATTTRKTPAEDVLDYSEQLISTAKTVGSYVLDTYEPAATSVLQARARVAEAIKADWQPSIVPAVIDANLRLAEELNAAYVKAARATLA